MELRVTKAQKMIGIKILDGVDVWGSFEIRTPAEHKVAEMLVKIGVLKVLEKKNYGRIKSVASAA